MRVQNGAVSFTNHIILYFALVLDFEFTIGSRSTMQWRASKSNKLSNHTDSIHYSNGAIGRVAVGQGAHTDGTNQLCLQLAKHSIRGEDEEELKPGDFFRTPGKGRRGLTGRKTDAGW